MVCISAKSTNTDLNIQKTWMLFVSDGKNMELETCKNFYLLLFLWIQIMNTVLVNWVFPTYKFMMIEFHKSL